MKAHVSLCQDPMEQNLTFDPFDDFETSLITMSLTKSSKSTKVANSKI